MPREGVEQYAVIESPTDTTSTGTGDVKTVAPTAPKRATGCWISVATTAARITFDGTAPGVGVGPGVVIPAGAAPQFFPFAFGGLGGPSIKFAANAAGNAILSVIFVA